MLARSGRRCVAGERADIGQGLDVPAQADELVDPSGRQHRRDEAAKLGFQIRIAHGPRERPQGMRHVPLEQRAVAQHDPHAGFEVAPDARVGGGLHALTQPDHDRIAHRLVAELRLAGGAAHERDGGGVIDAELAFEPRLRGALAGELEHHRVDGELHALDVLAARRVHLAQLQAAVDHGMDHEPARIGLVHVAHELEALPQPFGDDGWIETRGGDVGESARRLDAALRAREVALCEQGRRQAVARRLPGMKALAHRAEHLAQARGLGRGNPERPAHLLCAEAEQLAARGRGAEDSGRAGGLI